MNIDTHAAQKLTVICWRHLLRTLDDVASSHITGKHDSNHSFVVEGLKTHHGFTTLLAFFFSDIPLDIDTRQEVVCANITDIVSLGLLANPPTECLFKDENPDVSKKLQDKNKTLEFLHKKLDQNEQNPMDFDDIWDDITEISQDIETLKSRQFVIGLRYDIYLQWVCDKLVEESTQQCLLLQSSVHETFERQSGDGIAPPESLQPAPLNNMVASRHSSLK